MSTFSQRGTEQRLAYNVCDSFMDVQSRRGMQRHFIDLV